MDVTELVEKSAGIVSLAAAIGIVLLLPLYFSQRRDLRRLVVWMEREPAHPQEDVAASELILDRAESELEELLGEAPAPAPSAPQPAPAEAPATGPVTAAERVTSERPALERITTEREALLPHPGWRRFARTVTQPRWLVTIAAAAVVLGVGAIFGSELLFGPEDEGRAPKGGGVDITETEVAVLNGTTVPGLGAKVGDDVEANDFDLGAVTTVAEPFDQTVIMFEPDHERAARKLARSLGVGAVQPIDRQAQRLAEGADVVVIAGEDRARG